MIRRTFYIITFALFITQLHAQEKGHITSDSLLVLFKTRSPFDVLLNSRVYYLTNFKKAYENEQLKPYLLKWLSREEYRDYTIERDIKKIKENSELTRTYITHKLLKQNHGEWLDSIMNNPLLYLKYQDSIISDKRTLAKADRKPSSYTLPSQALWWHTKIPYPESYTIIRELWEEQSKPVFEPNKNFLNQYFLALVAIGDPEARRLFDEQITTFINTKGQSIFYGELNSILLNMKNSYAISKMLELLKVKQKFRWTSDVSEPATPFNCEMWRNLIFEFNAHSIEVDSRIKFDAPCESQLKFIKEINEAGQKLINQYKQQESYWMRNMPFYKE